MEIRINQAVLDNLTKEAKESPRLRMHMDLRNNVNDQSQRMVIAIELGSTVPIHRHQKTSETVVCLRGKLVVELYDDLERICTDSIILTHDGQTVAINIPMGQWHTAHALDSGTVIMKVKDGPYESLSDVDILK
jgi:cupin fold WbuC family metalloprotein